MEGLRIISQNMAGGTLYLHHVLQTLKPDILFLQENCVKTVDLKSKVKKFGYNCEANIDVMNPNKPGTAVVWKATLPSPQVQNMEECRLQSFKLGSTT